jgi:hypothetical protein
MIVVKMLITKPFTRRSGFRDATLIVIATEGDRTEPIYFDGLKEKFHKPSLHLEVLKRTDPSLSSPEHVLRELDGFKREYKLGKDDELWMVVDRDRWPELTLSEVARQCEQKRFYIAVSNPCFELWLLLHHTDLPSFTTSPTSREMEEMLRSAIGAYNKNNPAIENLIPGIRVAIERAEILDENPADRWPQRTGTRVYLLARKIVS